jgi:hypothetical protein
VYFNNRVPGFVEAKIIDGCTGRGLEDDAWLAQLYAAPGLWFSDAADSPLRPVGVPVNFRTGAAAGYVQTSGTNSFGQAVSATVVIPLVFPGWPVTVQVRAWRTIAGKTYEEAAASLRGLVGRSNLVRIPAVGGGLAGPSFLTSLESFTLLHLAGPLIRGGPEDQTVAAGDTVVFRVIILASPISLQWQREVAAEEWRDIPGATGPELVIPQARPSDAGRYRVVVEYVGCVGQSQPATLRVVERPRLTNVERLSNGAVRLNLSGAAGLTYQLRASSDLRDWSTVIGSMTNETGVVEFVDDVAGGFRQRFYRAERLP